MSAIEQSSLAPAFDLVAVVTSLGGLDAVGTVLNGLPGGFCVPMIVLQHGRARGDGEEQLPALWQRRTRTPVRGVGPDTNLRRPGITVLPVGRTADISPDGSLQPRPADRFGGGDALLSSAAAAFGPGVLGVVLTGMLHDGAEGVRAIKRNGGRVLAQDPATARAPGMPSAAIATGCVDFVLPLQRIASAIVALTMAPGGAEMLAVPTPPWARLNA